MDTDPFELATLRVSPTQLQQAKAARPKKWRRHYVQFPWAWAERLQAAKRISTYRLALLLLYEHWRTGGQSIELSNSASKQEGLTRWSKWNALAELEELGLVEVERRPKKSPRIVVLLRQT
jgi:hypothetical protein